MYKHYVLHSNETYFSRPSSLYWLIDTVNFHSYGFVTSYPVPVMFMFKITQILHYGNPCLLNIYELLYPFNKCASSNPVFYYH